MDYRFNALSIFQPGVRFCGEVDIIDKGGGEGRREKWDAEDMCPVLLNKSP